MQSKTAIPTLAIAAYSGTGKTTLLKQLIPLLNSESINVAIIKHSHHDIDIDTPGKDSDILRKAGARQTVIASDSRWALITETPDCQPIDLYQLVKQLDKNQIDLVLVEGFKSEPIEKIMLYRQDVGKPFNNIIDENTIALASDREYQLSIPQLDINNPQQIALFIVDWLQNKGKLVL